MCIAAADGVIARILVLAAVLAAASAPSPACPVCHTPTGEQVRRGIFGDRFARTALEVSAPFPFFALGLLGVRRILRRAPPDR